MATARTLTSLGRAARTEAKAKVRQPLSKALVLVPSGDGLPAPIVHEIADELNVKELEGITTLEGLLEYSVIPNFKRLGPRVGPKMPAVKAALAALDGGDVRRAFNAGETYPLTVAGENLDLGPDDVELRATRHAELALAEEGGFAVALDLHITDELRLEGVARELIRALNDHRKAIGLEIADRIHVKLIADGEAYQAASTHAERIAADVLATDFEVAHDTPTGELLVIDGSEVGVEVRKA